MLNQICHAAKRVALASALLTLSLSAVNATGPENQVILDAQQNANLRSVVRFTDGNGNAPPTGTGSIIGKTIVGTNGYLCVLTADHVVRAGAITHINFLNEGAGTNLPIVRKILNVPGGNPNPVDIGLALVRYGTPDDFFDDLVALNIATTPVAIGANISEPGFGNVGNRVNNGNGDYIGLNEQAGTSGEKRYQNNDVTNRAINFTRTYSGQTYSYRAVQYDFDAAVDALGNATNRDVEGEGFSFPGDSGAPLFTSALHDLDGPDEDALPTLFTDTIVAIDAFGPVGQIRDGARESVPDVVFYRNSIIGNCEMLMASLSAPEPGSIALMVFGMGGLGIILRRRANG